MIKSFKLLLSMLLILTAGSLLFSAQVNVAGDKVVKINNRIITLKELEKKFDQRSKLIGADGKPITADGKPLTKKSVLESMIDEELLTTELKNKNLPIDENQVTQQINDTKQMYMQDMLRQNSNFKYTEEGFKSYLEKEVNITYDTFAQQIRTQILAQQFIKKRAEKKIQDAQQKQYPDSTIQNLYDQNITQFVVPKSVVLKHIFFKTIAADGKPMSDADKQSVKKKADDVLSRIKKGETFDNMCELYSDDESSKSATNPTTKKLDRGYLGIMPISGQVADYYRKGFGDTLYNQFFQMDKGISGIMESKVGYHIFLVLDKKNEYIVPFAEAKPQIIRTLQMNDSQKAMADEYVALIKELRAKANIQYFMNEYK
jgi:parvulin-like peptidyl-prolyl isomerase